jgi:nicotinate-nucleotide adenylyltransferase
MTRYAVYGGSFNPIHYGHLTMVTRAAELGYKVIVVPAYRHAFGKQSAPFDHRLRMCELALQANGLQQHAQVCTIERSLAQGSDQPIYTYDVLCALRRHLQATPCLLVGPDIIREWERWYRHKEIEGEFGRLCLPVTRAIRSTELRRQVRAGASVAALSHDLPAPVAAYIIAHGLYRD